MRITVETVHAYVASHPKTVGVMFAVLSGYAAYHCFLAGMSVAVIRGNAAMAASEALGG